MSSQFPCVIDISHSERAQTHREIDAACRESGVFQIAGHGIDTRLIASLRRQMRMLFAQAPAVKQAIARTADNPWGFYDRELTRYTRDWKEIYDYGPADGEAIVPQWPSGLPAFKPVIQAYYEACDALAIRLLRVMARNLGMPPDSLDAHFRPQHTSFLRLNYYPRCDENLAGRLGVNPHTDAGAITLLLQDDQPGLQIFHRGVWWPVEPRPDLLVVNLGDIAQVWSNDQYVAPLHRAIVHSKVERFSVPYFLNPVYSAEYAPLPSTVDARHPPRYRPIQWREFRERRAAGDYANGREYVEISQYKMGTSLVS
jgi:isopenicillin N synthase-like dioxygenase